MSCFCSLFVILCAFSSCLSAIFDRLDTKIGRTKCSAYLLCSFVDDSSLSFIPWFVRGIR